VSAAPRKRRPAAPPVQVTEALLFDLDMPPDHAPPPTPEAPAADVTAADVTAPDVPPGPSDAAAAVSPRERGPLGGLMDDNFLRFASYTICNRAIPAVEDGLKPVQRRILHALHELDDGRFIKVANVVGHTMKYHPHGDAAIGDAIVNLVNKRFLIEGQGNFGNPHTGDSAAAPRYIECRLTDLARREIFNPKITRHVPSYDGRAREPVLLPAKLPLLLMMGAEGIAVGLSTAIPPHNFIELLEAQIAIVRNKPFAVLPDFPAGGTMDVSEYNDGAGRIRLRARIETRPGGRLAIVELPFGQTTETLIASVEEAIRRRKVPVRQINDYTAEGVEIELVLSPGTSPEAAVKALYAFTACESSFSSRIVVLRDNRPCEMTVSEVLRFNTGRLLDLLRQELEIRRDELREDFHQKTLEQIFIEERIYKRIEEMPTAERIQEAVREGFAPFRERLRRDLTPEDIEKLLQIRIRRISRHDIDRSRRELEAILKEQAEVEANLKGLRDYAVRYLRRLVKENRDRHPRRTRQAVFKEIAVRELTRRELLLRLDRESGYLGHGLRGGEELFHCSSLDRIVVVWEDGRYKVLPPPEKMFVDRGLLHCAVFDRERLMICVYTEPRHGFTYLKRFAFGGAIQNKEYRLAPPGSKLLLLQEGTPAAIHVKYRPAKGQRIRQQVFNPADAPVRGVAARGSQLTAKAIARLATEKPAWWDEKEKTPGGVLL
jgi:topoisomerase-4 subunit A